MPKYCPTCGNSSDKIAFFGNFCEKCSKGRFSALLPSKVEISRCKRCGKIKSDGQYTEPNGRAIESAIRPYFKGFIMHLISHSEGSARIDVSEEMENGTLSVESEISIEYKKTLCDKCYKKACNYHEAVMQLRGNPHKIEKFADRVTRFFESNNEFVTRTEPKDNGIDMYLSSKRLAGALISKMKLHPNTSFTLAGVKGGKKLYKNTYAIRFD